jgi:hypothetical protein
MIDDFNNFYAIDLSGRLLSATEFRDALGRDGAELRLIPVNAAARPGFRHAEKALDYYRRGLPEWYMWWGNNVFAQDRAPVAHLLGQVHQAAAQLGGVVIGVHPRIRILAAAENRGQWEAMRWLRLRLFATGAVGALAMLCLMGWLASRRTARERRP